MADSFDVIVVGARCAGAPLATLLARQGLSVALVERATFPRDTLSTHIFQAQAINLLKRLGVLRAVQATGAECLNRLDFRQDTFRTKTTFLKRPGDLGGAMSVRRFKLDPILADAAGTAGAEVMMGTAVTDLVRGDGRVTGVRVRAGGSELGLSARLVVGADGRNSTIGKLVGARKYHVVPGERFAYWGFFEGISDDPDREFVFHHWDGRLVAACPADSGLYQVNLVPSNRFLPEFRANLTGAFMDHVRACEPVAAKLGDATPSGKLFGIIRFESFFRESAGPGWVLVGDAGQFKDPTPGQGMMDAFRQAEALAPVIEGAIGRSDAEIDAATATWAQWRDRDAFEHHWLACDLGAAGSMPTVLTALMAELDAADRFGEVVDLLEHRLRPSQVVTPPRLFATAGRMLLQPGCDRRAVLREVRELVATDMRRRRLRRRPRFVDPLVHADAGETEVPDAVPA